MTGAEFSGVDIDLLADYVGGALDGTPDETVVSALIADDPAWRDVYDRLSGGVAAVTGQLQALGSIDEPMPADVVARVDAALLAAAGDQVGGAKVVPIGEARSAAAASDVTGSDVTPSDVSAPGASPFGSSLSDVTSSRAPASGSSLSDVTSSDIASSGGSVSGGSVSGGAASGGAASGGAASGGAASGGAASGSTVSGRLSSGATGSAGPMEPGTDGAAPDRHLVAVPSGSRSKRARRLRWAAPVGVAAGVLAFAGFAVQHFPVSSSSDDTQSTAAGSAPEQAADLPSAAAGVQELALPTGSVPVTESGTSYSRETLGQGSRTMIAPDLPQQEPGSKRNSAPSGGVSSKAEDSFDRLRVQEALRACIEAIAAEQGAGAITPRTIDFARFDGSPALVVEFTAAGDSWVWAVGPGCGAPGVGADARASVKVG